MRADLGVVERGILILCKPPDVVQQTGGKQHVEVYRLLAFGDEKRRIQHAVHMLTVVRTLQHAGVHVGFDFFVIGGGHGGLLW